MMKEKLKIIVEAMMLTAAPVVVVTVMVADQLDVEWMWWVLKLFAPFLNH